MMKSIRSITKALISSNTLLSCAARSGSFSDSGAEVAVRSCTSSVSMRPAATDTG